MNGERVKEVVRRLRGMAEYPENVGGADAVHLRDDAADELERLRKVEVIAMKAVSERDAADAEIARLRKALKPFAALAARAHPRTMEEATCLATFKTADLKRAAEVLK